MSWRENEGTLEQGFETPGRQSEMPRREIRSNSVTHHRARAKVTDEMVRYRSAHQYQNTTATTTAVRVQISGFELENIIRTMSRADGTQVPQQRDTVE